MKKEILVTKDDLQKFVSKDNYKKLTKYIRKKGKFKTGFWLIAEETGEIGT